MNTSTMSLPRPTFSAIFPRGGENTQPAPSTPKPAPVTARGTSFLKAHWKEIGVAALGLLGWRSARLRPLLRKAAMLYAVPAAKKVFARAAR